MHKKRIMKAGIWLIVVFGLTQLIRLASNIALTRLLHPEIFGLMAVVSSLMAGFAMFTDVGLNPFIIRHKRGLKKDILNCVWKMQVIRGWLITILAFAIAFTLYIYQAFFSVDTNNVFSESELPMILAVVAIASLITAYQSLAKPILTKKLISGPMELIDLSAQVLVTVVTITLAYFMGNIWSLVIGLVFANVYKTLLVNKLFSFKHKFEWTKETYTEVINFGKWIFIASGITFIANQGDRLILSTNISSSELGYYFIACMMIDAAIMLIRRFVSNVWLPVFSVSANKSIDELFAKYNKARFIQDIPVFVIVGFILAYSGHIVDILYDSRYADVSWMLQFLSFNIVAVALSAAGLECLSALGFTKIRTQIITIQALVLFIFLPIILPLYGLKSALLVIVVSYFAPIPLLYLTLSKYKLFSFWIELRYLPLLYLSYEFFSMVKF
ncbi:hypothetical protein LCGC14_1995920 [marine sediment metagenome]|uniref:Polysaccharide biosynthesis protein C-terminal domain-containing protein n=1 Tax=marine sediment metagenome TaxID=412755 RepID=A0A0F9I1T8_9ZZZZ